MPTDIVDLLKEPRMIKVSAPMVRYSKLQFRTLLRRYECDICFSPMILADSFVQSSKARSNEFTTNGKDKPLIVQFAANTSYDFVRATEMVAPYCDGVDLNSGCPQRWAVKAGYGADLLRKPEVLKDLVHQTRNRISNIFTVSVKIRLLKDIKETINICKILEKAGASFLTIHGRTPEMRNEPINLDGIKTIRSFVQLPLIANGDIKNLKNAEDLYNESNCEAVMAARGILTNPALFSGHPVTPLSCIQDWLNITSSIPTHFLCFHHHLVFMLEKLLSKKDRLLFNTLKNRLSVLEFLEDQFNIKPHLESEQLHPIECNFYTSDLQYNANHTKDFKEDTFYDPLGNIFQE